MTSGTLHIFSNRTQPPQNYSLSFLKTIMQTTLGTPLISFEEGINSFQFHLNSWILGPFVFFKRVCELMAPVVNIIASVNTGCVVGGESWGNNESDQFLLNNQYSASFCFHAIIPRFSLPNLLSLTAPVQLLVFHYYRMPQPSEDSNFALLSVHDYDLL